MPQEVTLKGPTYTFACYGVHEAKQLGLIDSWGRQGTHAPISTTFEQGEGKLLADWIEKMPDALLVATGRYQIVVHRPKHKLVIDPDEPQLEEQENESADCAVGVEEGEVAA